MGPKHMKTYSYIRKITKYELAYVKADSEAEARERVSDGGDGVRFEEDPDIIEDTPWKLEEVYE